MGQSISQGVEEPAKLRKVRKAMADSKKRLTELEAQKTELEKALKK